MLLDVIFKEFISVVQENQKYTIGLLSEAGIVVSCSKVEFIGIGFDVSNPRKNDTFYSIEVKGINYGFLWVNGDDDSLKMISNLILDSLKTRILYEVNENILKRELTKDDKLVRALIHDSDFDAEYVLKLVKELKVDQNVTRVAIHVVNNNGFDIDEIKGLKLRSDSKNTFYSMLDKNNLLFFKDIPSTSGIKEAKTYLVEYIESLKEWGLQNCYFSIGSFQNKLSSYNVSYENCLWIQKNDFLELDKPVFFSDRLLEYYIFTINFTNVLSNFQYCIDGAKEVDVEELATIAQQLIMNDYNITQTAQDLYLHKNTLIYKIKKYEELFGIDIRGSFQGKVLFLFIAHAMNEKKKQKLVGEKR